MVDHGIGVHIHAGGVTTLDHVSKRAGVATAAVQLITYRLIAGPPGTALDMLLGRRYLNRTESFGAQEVFAFLGDVAPCPFKQMHKGTGLGLLGWQCQCKSERGTGCQSGE